MCDARAGLLMPRKTIGDRPLTPAERQARRRVKAKEQPKWEYLLEAHHNDADALNAFGAEGWELVAVRDQFGFFKRRVL